ncbi:hypothetical protein [Actinomadura madurae]|uniref:hypothetical protein n=1 Tax=Actinomadura madurae TaxID=1993 RepID=UPI000DD0A618|nr:hypothetical protein [Actinomadura madurae]
MPASDVRTAPPKRFRPKRDARPGAYLDRRAIDRDQAGRFLRGAPRDGRLVGAIDGGGVRALVWYG